MWPVVPNREEESKRRSTNWLHLAPIELKAPCMICRHWWCDEGQDDRTNHWIVVQPTHLKNISQNWLFPQVRMKMKNICNHHLVVLLWKRNINVVLAISGGWGICRTIRSAKKSQLILAVCSLEGNTSWIIRSTVKLSLYVAMFVEFDRISFLQKVLSSPYTLGRRSFPMFPSFPYKWAMKKKHACSGLFGDWTTQLCMD